MAPRRLLLLVTLVLLGALAAPASGDDYSRKQTIDARLRNVQAKIAWAERRQRALSARLDSVNARLRALAGQVGDVSAQLATIERDLALHEQKLDRLTELYRVETTRFLSLKRQYEITVERLNGRLVELYEGGEPSTLEVLLSSRSFSDLISRSEYVDSLRIQDQRIAGQIGPAKAQARAQRLRTRRFRAVVAAETRTIAVRTAQVRSVRETLLSQKHQLASARSNRRESLIKIDESKREFLHEAAGIANDFETLFANRVGELPREAALEVVHRLRTHQRRDRRKRRRAARRKRCGRRRNGERLLQRLGHWPHLLRVHRRRRVQSHEEREQQRHQVGIGDEPAVGP